MDQLDQQQPTRSQHQERRWRDDWPVAVVAAGAAAAVWVAVTQLAPADLVVRSGSGTQSVGLASVVVASLVAAMAGAGLLRVLERRTPQGLTLWTCLAVAVLLVSMAGPAGAESAAAGGCLALLHLVVGAVVVVGLRVRRSGRVA